MRSRREIRVFLELQINQFSMRDLVPEVYFFVIFMISMVFYSLKMEVSLIYALSIACFWGAVKVFFTYFLDFFG